MNKKLLVLSASIVLAPWIALPFSFELCLFLFGFKTGVLLTLIEVASYLRKKA